MTHDEAATQLREFMRHLGTDFILSKPSHVSARHLREAVPTLDRAMIEGWRAIDDAPAGIRAALADLAAELFEELMGEPMAIIDVPPGPTELLPLRALGASLHRSIGRKPSGARSS